MEFDECYSLIGRDGIFLVSTFGVDLVVSGFPLPVLELLSVSVLSRTHFLTS